MSLNPTTATAPSPPARAAGRGVFSGTREAYLLPAGSEATLGIGPDGRAGLYESFGRRDLFVLTEVRDGRYWIRTTRPPNGNAGPAAIFGGRRQVFLLPGSGTTTLGVGADGRVGPSGAFDDATLFVLTKVTGDRYWIRTGKLRAGGEARCLGTEATGDGPGTVRAVPCDAADAGQLWRFREAGTAEGRPTYTIYTGRDRFIVEDPDGDLDPGGTGVAAVRIDEGAPDIDTPFLLSDQGPAELPALD